MDTLERRGAWGLIDVSAWAGTTDELFFGFLGGTSSNATPVIENIRFYSVEAPRLEIVQGGSTALLNWSSTAGGYIVETTPTLSSPAWEALTNAPTISGDQLCPDELVERRGAVLPFAAAVNPAAASLYFFAAAGP